MIEETKHTLMTVLLGVVINVFAVVAVSSLNWKTHQGRITGVIGLAASGSLIFVMWSMGLLSINEGFLQTMLLFAGVVAGTVIRPLWRAACHKCGLQ